MHHEEDKLQRPPHWRFRSSKPFIYLVVSLAVFTDAYLYGLIIPVLPFALTEVVHLHEEDVQKWIGILLGVYGAALFLGSRKRRRFWGHMSTGRPCSHPLLFSS